MGFRIDSSFATSSKEDKQEVAEEESENLIHKKVIKASGDNPQAPMLYEGARINHAESEALIMAFVLNHSLSEKGLENLLELLNCHLPIPVYSSKFAFLKKLPTTEPKKNFFCKQCEVSLEFGDSDELLCECEAINLKKESINNNNFFFDTVD
ncbi:uncharacterized protein LOC107274837 [Cephus cinctus]|uniref:Uncharacterized protein LOC107274837 n=1 Tax=Cephus cinctus TaxID=211228 RepID=A0AAJ7CH30_CEPCN|nr:uncharacterized protein LOC107274837 [Cephus cinctus]